MAEIILINPDYYDDIFNKSKVQSAISRGTTPLGLACIAASLLRDGHRVRVLDLNLADDPDGLLKKTVTENKPDFVGITSTTPLIKKAGVPLAPVFWELILPSSLSIEKWNTTTRPSTSG